MASPQDVRRPPRIRAIDVARGSAMFLVFLSHFSLEELRAVGAGHIQKSLTWVTHVATPAFVLLSGIMLGLLRFERRDDFAAMRDRLIDRGLFLLIVCHPVIALAHVAGARVWHEPFWDQVFITDTIGFALIFGAMIAYRVNIKGRAQLGTLVLLCSWIFEVLWIPEEPLLRIIKEVLLGRLRGESLAYNFPLLPWFGLYLIGSAIGQTMAEWRARGHIDRPHRLAFLLSAIALLTVTAVKIIAAPFKPVHPVGPETVYGRLLHLLALTEKIPPSPAYLLLFGGVALGGVGIALWAETRDLRTGRGFGIFRRTTAMLGRNSLIAFVLQFYVYYTAVDWLPKPPLAWAPAYFLLTVVVLLMAVRVCDRYGLNSYFTVGYARRGDHENATPDTTRSGARATPLAMAVPMGGDVGLMGSQSRRIRGSGRRPE